MRLDAPSNKCHIRNDSLKIFISSRQEELKRERDLACDAVEQTGHDLGKPLKPFLDENEAATPSTTIISHCSENIKDSKAVICIYYKTVSEIVKNEFRWANDRGIPIFIFKKEPQGRDEADEDLTTFIENEVRPSSIKSPGPYGIYVFKRFNCDDIKANIIKSLKEYYPTWFNFRPIPEKYIPSATEPDRLDRTRHVYVKPKCYPKAEEILKNNRLLIISGPAHLGKTSMGFHLADSFKETVSRRFILFPDIGDFSDITSLHDSIIVFDDPFGGVTFNNPFIGDKFDSIIAMATSNHIIITSRKEVLNDACKSTRLGENKLESSILEIKQVDYVDETFEVILENHLKYFHADQATRELANAHKIEIMKELRFPHNYEVLVRNELNEVLRGKKDFNDCLRDAKQIERAVGNWFQSWYSKDKEVFYFLLMLTHCGILQEEEDFLRVYKKCIKRLNNEKGLGIPQHSSISRLKQYTSPYVSKSNFVKFEHPSYGAGIKDCAREYWPEEALIISKEMADDISFLVRTQAVLGLGGVEKFYSEDALPILKKLARDKHVVVRLVATLILMDVRKHPLEMIPILENLARDEESGLKSWAKEALKKWVSMKNELRNANDKGKNNC